MAEIVWTLEATRWLEEIHDYISLDSTSAAHRVITGIYDKVQLLREQPRMGQRFEPIVDREVREILYGHYRIAYLIKSEEQIELLGIFHAAMDIEHYLT
ncbi:MAG: type II toxin-antitoxin system RelE/ParE family toxin [Pirellulaceae bacterium]